MNNFGDLLGPLIVREIVSRALGGGAEPVGAKVLMSVGSVIHLASPGTVVWGSGVNGKVVADYSSKKLDIRAVRGPRSRDRLLSAGHAVPEIYGDPALLLGTLFPGLRSQAPKFDVTVVMNLNDPVPRTTHNILDPRRELWDCLRVIAQSRVVVGSSLHGLIVADALGIPNAPIASAVENPFKYEDYYLGTGREYYPSGSVSQAADRASAVPLLWEAAPLLRAFPFDLWTSGPIAAARWLDSLL